MHFGEVCHLPLVLSLKLRYVHVITKRWGGLPLYLQAKAREEDEQTDGASTDIGALGHVAGLGDWPHAGGGHGGYRAVYRDNKRVLPIEVG
jgi:hypothetical protein